MPTRFLPRDRWQVIGAFLTIVLVSVGLTLFFDHRLDQAEKRITRNTELAIEAKVQSARAEDFVENFRQRIADEKVCTESNRGDPCRALFQRLAEDISSEQRRDLACAIAQELQLRPQYQAFCG